MINRINLFKMKLNNITLILYLISYHIYEVFPINLRQKLNQAVSKAKSIYKNKYGKDNTMHFLGYDMTEYPGTNMKMKKIQIDKWEEYYTCLWKQENSYGKHGSIIPEAVLALEGESIKLECKVCLSPLESDNIESIEWEWSQVNDKYLEPVEYDEHTLLSPEDKTLHLYNIGTEHIGQYVCKLGKQLTAPYFLTVVNNSEPLSMVHPKNAPKGPYPEISWKISNDIILDTVWSKWSPCDTCGKVGRRHKYGHCTILLLSNIEKLDTSNTTEDIENDEKITEDETEPINYTHPSSQPIELSAVDQEFLEIFKYGIPCRSHILPESIKNIKEIIKRQSEVMIGYCKIKCPENQVFVVKDKYGKVIESANNSAGIYSMVQGLPSIEPPVERRLQFASTDSDIFVSCPGNLNSEVPIKWQIGGRNVIPSLLSKESNGRIYLSITDKIHIKMARQSDSNIYSCWQNQELAGTVRLVVEKTIKLNFNHHVMLMGMIIILLTFLYVFFKAFMGRKYVIGAK